MHERIVIIGGPRVGKTTRANDLAERGGAPVFRTDDLIGTLDWSAASAHVAGWLDQPGPWIIEGVAAVRALRKWLAAHDAGKPADAVLLGLRPREPLTPGQQAMARGHQTIWSGIEDEVRRRGVSVCTF